MCRHTWLQCLIKFTGMFYLQDTYATANQRRLTDTQNLNRLIDHTETNQTQKIIIKSSKKCGLWGCKNRFPVSWPDNTILS